MRSNEELQKDVQDAIKWEPLLNAAEIGVSVNEGIVTLSGTVDNYMKKLEAEDAAKKVLGVKAVVENIKVKFYSHLKDDTEIAIEALNTMKWNLEMPEDKENVKIKVENGWVMLEGEVKWNYLKESIEKSISELMGVVGVTNNINIKATSNDEIERNDIENAFGRNANLNHKGIQVHVTDNRVTLNGTVESWYQKDEATRIAWNARGVWTVHNELVIEPIY